MRGGLQTIDRQRPPDLAEPEGGGGGGWVLLLTARGIIEAQLVRGLLEAAGIVPVHLDAHDPSPGAWLFLSGNVNAPVRVYVLRSSADAARIALLEGGFAHDETEEADELAEPVSRASWYRAAWIVIAAVIVLGFALRLLADGCTVC